MYFSYVIKSELFFNLEGLDWHRDRFPIGPLVKQLTQMYIIVTTLCCVTRDFKQKLEQGGLEQKRQSEENSQRHKTHAQVPIF